MITGLEKAYDIGYFVLSGIWPLGGDRQLMFVICASCSILYFCCCGGGGGEISVMRFADCLTEFMLKMQDGNFSCIGFDV